jgi:hypothetical protein
MGISAPRRSDSGGTVIELIPLISNDAESLLRKFPFLSYTLIEYTPLGKDDALIACVAGDAVPRGGVVVNAFPPRRAP